VLLGSDLDCWLKTFPQRKPQAQMTSLVTVTTFKGKDNNNPTHTLSENT